MKYLLCIVLCWLAGITQAQVTNRPQYAVSANPGLSVEKVEITNDNTIVHLLFQNNTGGDLYLELDPYTFVKEKHSVKSHTLLKLENMSISPAQTWVGNKSYHRFVLYFPAISAGCYEFDLFECPRENCFNISGIKVQNNRVATGPVEKRFIREYSFISVYDKQQQKWGDWVRGNYVFIFNMNDKNQLKLNISDQQSFLFTPLTSPQRGTDAAGSGYQYIEVQDEQGTKATLILYDSGDTQLIFPTGEAFQFTSE